jgi:hypothetical protein
MFRRHSAVRIFLAQHAGRQVKKRSGLCKSGDVVPVLLAENCGRQVVEPRHEANADDSGVDGLETRKGRVCPVGCGNGLSLVWFRLHTQGTVMSEPKLAQSGSNLQNWNKMDTGDLLLLAADPPWSRLHALWRVRRSAHAPQPA